MTKAANADTRAARARAAALPGGLFLIALGFYADTYSGVHSRAGFGDPFGPTFFPRIILVAWMGLSAVAAIVALLTPPKDLAGNEPTDWRPAAFVCLSTGLFVFFVVAIGFLPASLVYFPACALIFGKADRRVAFLIASAVVPVSIWYLFHHVVQIRLPTGFVWG